MPKIYKLRKISQQSDNFLQSHSQIIISNKAECQKKATKTEFNLADSAYGSFPTFTPNTLLFQLIYFIPWAQDVQFTS